MSDSASRHASLRQYSMPMTNFIPARARVLTVAVLAVSTAAFGEMPSTSPSTIPSTEPTTKVADATPTPRPSGRSGRVRTISTTQPTSRPATAPTSSVASAKFPTPAELIKKMREKKAVEDSKAQIALIDLGHGFPEKPATPSAMSILGGGGAGETFQELLERFHAARDNKSIKAVLLTMNTGTGLNMAQVQELRGEIDQLKKADKRVFTYADTYDTRSYLLASAATDVCMLEAGEIFMPGVGIESMFYKGTFDKLGIKADYVQIGEYKGAEEPYTRDKPSDELAGQMDKLTKNLMDEVVNGISGSRGIAADKVRKLMDGVLINATRADKAGLVDHLTDADGLRDLMKDELGEEINIKENFGEKEGPQIDFSNPFAILTAMAAKPTETELPKVAIIYAQGVITDGEGGGSDIPLVSGGPNVASEPMRRAFRMAMRDDNVKAVVVRIDSPGGSALASEVMWQSMRHLAEKKPVVVSIGGMAASGGYYLSSAADCIYADPAAIVGSIGVVGGKMVLGGLYEKVGLSTATFTQGKNADIYSSTTEWTESQRRMIKGWMKDTYDQFTDRIETTRGKKIADIDAVARGRIFTAREAKAFGMVDELGGLDQAITEAAMRAKLEKGKYDLKSLPPPPTLQEMLGRRGGIGVTAPISGESATIFSLLPADIRASLGQTIQLGQLMERRPVVLMSPFVVNVK